MVDKSGCLGFSAEGDKEAESSVVLCVLTAPCSVLRLRTGFPVGGNCALGSMWSLLLERGA